MMSASGDTSNIDGDGPDRSDFDAADPRTDSRRARLLLEQALAILDAGQEAVAAAYVAIALDSLDRASDQTAG